MSEEPALATILEAILFGAGRSMSLDEFSEMLGEPKGVIHVGLSTPVSYTHLTLPTPPNV